MGDREIGKVRFQYFVTPVAALKYTYHPGMLEAVEPKALQTSCNIQQNSTTLATMRSRQNPFHVTN